MKTGELLDCPFCNFTDHDHYFLLQHVETIHPEGGRPSPFTVRDEVTHQLEPPVEEMEGARDSSSEYIECQCGEFCLLTEFESHLDMHYAEGMGFDETPKTPADQASSGDILSPGKASPPQMEITLPSPLHIVTSGPSQPIPIRSVVECSHRSASRRSGNAVRDFMDVLRHSTSPTPTKPSQATRNRVPRRLGVRDTGNVFVNIPADDSNRGLSWALMLTKNKCQIGYARSLRSAQKSRSSIRSLQMVDCCE